MNNQQKQFFEERYRGMSDEELVDIQRKGDLTDLASGVLEAVLAERGITPDKRAAIAVQMEQYSGNAAASNLASLSDRFLGQFLDNIIAIVVGVVVYFVLRPFSGADGSLAGGSAVVAWLLYNLLSDGLRGGQSFGKRMAGTAVVFGKDQMPCTFWRSLLRNIPLMVLGLIDWMFILGKDRKRVGDHIAGTEVIRFSKPVTSTRPA